jgi:catechol 2,3-dioxygenase-like lactoylglutathione lyase family enzyme
LVLFLEKGLLAFTYPNQSREMPPQKLPSVVEIKAFVPARDFELSKAFYRDIGFTMASDGGGIAYFHCGNASFLLQDFCSESVAENFSMHLLVQDVDAWWSHIKHSSVVEKYGVKLTDIEQQPWRMRDFCLTDPSGVLWRIAQNTD